MNKIYIKILIFGLIVNLLIFFDIQFLYLRAIFSFVFLIAIPGLLILLAFKLKADGFWENVIYVIGLSIAFLLLAGLAINTILPLLGVEKPLSVIPLLISFDVIILLFFRIVYKKNAYMNCKMKFPKLDILNKFLIITPLIFIVLSILGAIMQNNNGSNIFTMIVLGGMVIYIFIIVLFRKKVNENIFPWAILIISVSLLLMFSLRSWHISGSDINEEFRMFQLTLQNFHWSMSNSPGNAYNACLSITILPTIFSVILNINDEYIYKLIFQILFSFTPVGIYLFLKRYTQRIFAFVGVFFFVSQPQFFQQMPALARQEIAILFFVLSLVVLFNKEISTNLKNTLFLIFGFSMIISHYSTTYVAIFLFMFVYLMGFVFRNTEDRIPFNRIYEKLNLKVKGEKVQGRNFYLSGFMVFILIILVFIWYFQLTKISGNLVYVAYNTIKNMGKIFTQEMKSDEAAGALFGGAGGFTLEDIQEYATDITLIYHTEEDHINFYPPEKYKEYSPRPLYAEKLPAISQKAQKVIYYFHEIAKKLIKVFLIIGVFCFFFTQFKKREMDIEYIFMILGCISLVGIILFVPYLSIAYNFERLYQQSLIVLSLPIVLGGYVLSKFCGKGNVNVVLLVIIFIWYFLPYSGFTSQIFGGEPAMQLNNFGETYDRFYTHESEVRSAQWLSSYYDKNFLIYADNYSEHRLIAFSKINTPFYLDILPSTIDQEAYVYSSFANTMKHKGFARRYKGKYMSYNFPTEFLNQNKNLIYNNGGSKIFK